MKTKIMIYLLLSLVSSCVIFFFGNSDNLPLQRQKINPPSELFNVKYNANEYVKPYQEYYLFGSNMGYYPGFKDEDISDLCINAGVRSLRLSLPAFYLDKHGYNFKIKTFEHYKSIGAKDNAVFLGYPADWQKDSVMYCTSKEKPAKIFKNLYEPVFIQINGTVQVNPENFYADYIFKTVSLYKDYVKFWELWNEPDFDETGAFGWKKRGQKGNWWDNDPDPCILKNIYAPVQYYVRMLRVAYQVIKFTDSNAYVCTGGIGYESFLDAILRNTDNPEQGKITDSYPLTGGAYFDCLSIHIYPQYENAVKHYDVSSKKFIFKRNSDAAASSLLKKKAIFDSVMAGYGYNGIKYPKKVFIMTEYNISRLSFKDFIGGEEVQKNFIIKAHSEIQRAGFSQAYIYCTMDADKKPDRNSPFDFMGLYRNAVKEKNNILLNSETKNSYLTNEGIAFKTAATILLNSRIDFELFNRLNKNDSIRIYPMKKSNGSYYYILWKIIDSDNDESGEAELDLTPLNLDKKYIFKWNYSISKTSESVSGNKIMINAEPVILSSSPDF